MHLSPFPFPLLRAVSIRKMKTVSTRAPAPLSCAPQKKEQKTSFANIFFAKRVFARQIYQTHSTTYNLIVYISSVW